MKAAIEFARDLLCIDEIDFDRWFKGTSWNKLNVLVKNKVNWEWNVR